MEAFKYFWIKAINVGTLVFQLYRVEKDAQSAAAIYKSAQAANLHACNMTLGVARADAECPAGLVCCDESCATALNSTALYVSLPLYVSLQRHIERQPRVSTFLPDTILLSGISWPASLSTAFCRYHSARQVHVMHGVQARFPVRCA